MAENEGFGLYEDWKTIEGEQIRPPSNQDEIYSHHHDKINYYQNIINEASKELPHSDRFGTYSKAIHDRFRRLNPEIKEYSERIEEEKDNLVNSLKLFSQGIIPFIMDDPSMGKATGNEGAAQEIPDVERRIEVDRFEREQGEIKSQPIPTLFDRLRKPFSHMHPYGSALPEDQALHHFRDFQKRKEAERELNQDQLYERGASLPMIKKEQGGIAGLAKHGRYGDSMLVHMAPEEVAGLASLTQNGVTINPETGLPEMFNLMDILPSIVTIGAGIMSGGALSPLAAAALSGLTTAAVSEGTVGEKLGKGLLAGIGSWGTGSLMKQLGAAGAQVGAASQPGIERFGAEAAKQGIPLDTTPQFGPEIFDSSTGLAKGWESISPDAKSFLAPHGVTDAASYQEFMKPAVAGMKGVKPVPNISQYGAPTAGPYGPIPPYSEGPMGPYAEAVTQQDLVRDFYRNPLPRSRPMYHREAVPQVLSSDPSQRLPLIKEEVPLARGPFDPYQPEPRYTEDSFRLMGRDRTPMTYSYTDDQLQKAAGALDPQLQASQAAIQHRDAPFLDRLQTSAKGLGQIDLESWSKAAPGKIAVGDLATPAMAAMAGIGSALPEPDYDDFETGRSSYSYGGPYVAERRRSRQLPPGYIPGVSPQLSYFAAGGTRGETVSGGLPTLSRELQRQAPSGHFPAYITPNEAGLLRSRGGGVPPGGGQYMSNGIPTFWSGAEADAAQADADAAASAAAAEAAGDSANPRGDHNDPNLVQIDLNPTAYGETPSAIGASGESGLAGASNPDMAAAAAAVDAAAAEAAAEEDTYGTMWGLIGKASGPFGAVTPETVEPPSGVGLTDPNTSQEDVANAMGSAGELSGMQGISLGAVKAGVIDKHGNVNPFSALSPGLSILASAANAPHGSLGTHGLTDPSDPDPTGEQGAIGGFDQQTFDAQAAYDRRNRLDQTQEEEEEGRIADAIYDYDRSLIAPPGDYRHGVDPQFPFYAMGGTRGKTVGGGLPTLYAQSGSYAQEGTEGMTIEENIDVETAAEVPTGVAATTGIMQGAPTEVQDDVAVRLTERSVEEPQNPRERAIYDRAVLALQGELEPEVAQRAIDEFLEVFGPDALHTLQQMVHGERENGGTVETVTGETTVADGEIQGPDIIAGKIVDPVTGEETANLRVGENEYIEPADSLARRAQVAGLPPTPENGAMIRGEEERMLRQAVG